MHHNPAMLAGSTCYGFSNPNVNTDDVIRVIYKHEYEQKTESEGGKNRTGVRSPITLSLSALRRLKRYTLTTGIPFLRVFSELYLRMLLKVNLLKFDLSRRCPWWRR